MPNGLDLDKVIFEQSDDEFEEESEHENETEDENDIDEAVEEYKTQLNCK